jgi:hypothetical protein
MNGKNACRSAHPERSRGQKQGAARGPIPLLPVLCTAALFPLLFAAAGCYTRFAEFEPVSEKAAGDTVPPRDSEVCIWERDLTGYPRLRCYPSSYPRQWYLYNYSPWWYHNRSHWYNAERCPPYYYFDTACGCCRYYLNNPDLVRSAGGAVRKKTDSTAAKDSNRVSITVSSGTSVHIPLTGSTAPVSPDARSVSGQPASAQGPTDSLATPPQGDSIAVLPARDTMKVVPVNRLRRSLRGR